jgi:hypothetical protein
MKTQKKILIDENNRLRPERNQFMRIAMAKLKPDYPFYPQRIAVAAAMYRRWYDRHS